MQRKDCDDDVGRSRHALETWWGLLRISACAWTRCEKRIRCGESAVPTDCGQWVSLSGRHIGWPLLPSFPPSSLRSGGFGWATFDGTLVSLPRLGLTLCSSAIELALVFLPWLLPTPPFSSLPSTFLPHLPSVTHLSSSQNSSPSLLRLSHYHSLTIHACAPIKNLLSASRSRFSTRVPHLDSYHSFSLKHSHPATVHHRTLCEYSSLQHVPPRFFSHRFRPL